jgi:hypothetical protein
MGLHDCVTRGSSSWHCCEVCVRLRDVVYPQVPERGENTVQRYISDAYLIDGRKVLLDPCFSLIGDGTLTPTSN